MQEYEFSQNNNMYEYTDKLEFHNSWHSIKLDQELDKILNVVI